MMPRALAKSGARAASSSVLLLLPLSLDCMPAPGTIGAVLAQTPEQHLVLRDVPTNLAAGQAGLQSGDEIILIDGRDVRELNQLGVHQALSGDVGDPVKLTLLREGRVIRVTLRRTPPPAKKG